jgi:hypothetical protein
MRFAILLTVVVAISGSALDACDFQLNRLDAGEENMVKGECLSKATTCWDDNSSPSCYFQRNTNCVEQSGDLIVDKLSTFLDTLDEGTLMYDGILKLIIDWEGYCVPLQQFAKAKSPKLFARVVEKIVRDKLDLHRELTDDDVRRATQAINDRTLSVKTSYGMAVGNGIHAFANAILKQP